jgi:chromosome segregation ATPase
MTSDRIRTSDLSAALDEQPGAADRGAEENTDRRDSGPTTTNLPGVVGELKGRLLQLIEANETLESEIEQLHGERTVLMEKTREMSQALGVSELRVQEIGGLLDKLRAERNDMGEEAACLSSQFARAMRAIEELREALAAREQREEELEERIQSLEGQLE